ncbi:MAG: O-sialoglycoprotein endopeptidase [Clostridia bacterium]|nr:O-sialoglycoprotein endopeptidase [Clostridia bacterium]
MKLYIGIDTSCYTTSAACIDKNKGIVCDLRTVLSVSLGERGLRQSEGVFQHVKNLPPLLERLFDGIDPKDVGAIGVSTRPTDREGSYMPVFLAGAQQARGLAAVLRVPLFETEHQRGHIRAALLGNGELWGKEFYAVHLSGGTTEVLAVDENLKVHSLGCSTDLHAGQFVDRTGVMLGCSFPAGRALEALATEARGKDIKIPSSVRGLTCSFSGAESFARRCFEGGADKTEVAYAVYDCLLRTLQKLLTNLFDREGERPVLLCGGVASSGLLKSLLSERFKKELYFSKPALSSDNAVGVAYLAMDSTNA